MMFPTQHSLSTTRPAIAAGREVLGFGNNKDGPGAPS
jgi:hypothetical protein